MDNIATSLGKLSIKLRWIFIFLTLTLVIVMSSGSQFLVFDTNYRAFFGKDNPQLKAFDELQTVYTKTDNITFVIKPKTGNIFTPEVLNAVKDFTTESWQLPYSGRVDSITNFQHTYADGDNLIVRDLVEKEPDSLTSEDLEEIRRVALSEPILVHNIVAADGNATGVNIVFNFPEKDIFEVPTTSQAAQTLLEKIQAKYPNLEMHASGIVSLNNAFSDASIKDMQVIIPIMYAVLLVSMFIFLRSFSATFSTLLVIAFSAASAIGLAGWIGIKLTPPSSAATTIILTLAIADSIHVIISMLKLMQHGMNKKDAIIESIRINFQPIFLTSFTTAIGFLSLNFSDSPPFHDLGNITAIGVIIAFFFSITFLPSILSLFPLRCKMLSKSETHKKTPMDLLGDFVVKYRKKLIYIMTAIIILLAFAIPKLKVDDQWLQYFDESIPFRVASEFLIENLTGIYRMEYSISASEPNGISNPKYLSKLQEYTNWLRKQPEVTHVYSMVDVFKRLNKNMHGDNEDWYKIPETKEMAAQYLLLYEFSLPYGLDLNDRINVDKSATRVSVILNGDMATQKIRSFKDKSEKWLTDNAPKYMHTEATSPSIMFAYIADRNIKGMMKGNIVALFLISLTILIALKSIKIGVFSLIPNLIPPIMGFGIWALLIGQVNMAVALVTSISLGIIVDDTVHFLSKYYRARREKNLNSHDAVRYAFSTVGSALTVTTFVLVFGFSVLVLSTFKMNSLMGLLTAIIIGCALIADFLLLPPLLMLLDKKNKTNKKA